MEIKTYVQWVNIKNSICSTCLSKDRSLTPANTMEHLKKPFPDLKFGLDDKICWECKAMLKKLTMFYERVHAAQALFMAAVKKGGINKLQSLSRLGIIQASCSEHNQYEETIKKEEELRDCSDDELSVKFELGVTYAHSPANSPAHSPANSSSGDSETETSSETEQLSLLNDRTEPQWMELTETLEIETVAKEERINFDTKTGKYYKEIFKAISLTDNDLAKIRQKKLNNPTFRNHPKKCLKCIESFHNEKAMEMHVVKHQNISGLFECKICQQRWHTQTALDEHTKSHYILFACLFCKQKFTVLQKALYHYDSYHYQSNRQCKDCSQTFSTGKQLARHRNQAHGTIYPCPQCDKTFTLRYKLNSHLRVHKKDVSIHECSICHKKYRGAIGLRRHTQLYHENKKVGQAEYCVQCDAQFPTAFALRKHLATSLKHNSYQDLKFECDPCGKRFSCKRSLQLHLEYRHDDRQYNCDHCPSVYKTRQHLRTHIRNKHEMRPRPRNFVCHVCGKAYREKPTLEQHLFAHRGYRPFVCDICSADFSHSGALYTHKRLKHGQKKKLEL